jgi:hypothetical protein
MQAVVSMIYQLTPVNTRANKDEFFLYDEAAHRALGDRRRRRRSGGT